ncbi:MAG: PilZ domain-containing protein [Candidatus Latescibacteria bacterium]|nr:PilZ domain-containing protein [Candidatus Latescibacterota bacterium]
MDDNLIAVLLLVLLLAVILALRVYQQHRKRQAQYQRRATDKGLKPAQRRLLWQVARQQRRNPVLLLRCASAFELCVGECVRTGGKQALLAELGRIRVLLGFDQLIPGQPLHTTRQLAQGQPLRLWPAGEETTPATDCLVVAKGASALVTTPLAGIAPPWSPGTPLRACFQREQGAQYRFATQLLACTPHTLSLQHVEQVQRLQAREFLRWDTSFPLTLQIPGRPSLVLEGQVLNLSGGGLRLKTSRALPIGTSVVVDPQHRGPFPLAGVKARVVANSPRSKGQTLHLQFVDLSRAIEAQIVRRIYQHQLNRPSRVPAHSQRRGGYDDRD